VRGFAAFEHSDFSGAIEALVPLAGDNERIGGSRAQHDLIEFTLLRAYINDYPWRKRAVCSVHAGRVPRASRSWGSRR
jgi:hypothetical protein